jgi:hypothetical protein
MSSSSVINSINFYVDDEGNAIPANIINRGESIQLVKTPISQLPEPVVLPLVQSQIKAQLWIYSTLALTGLLLLNMMFNRSPAHTETIMEHQSAPMQNTQQIAASVIQAAPVSYGKVLQNAQELAQRAYNFTQAAQSVDDWNLAANQLKKAIALLKTVPATSEDYTVAQQKINEYQTRLTSALQGANQPVTNTMPTTTITVGSGITCRDLMSFPDALPVMLTNVSFDSAAQPGQEANVVGCISNHTGRAITNVSIVYRGTSTADPSLFQAANATIYVDRIEPGQTIPFRSDFTIHPQVTSVSIESITWQSSDASEPQTSPIAVNINRES